MNGAYIVFLHNTNHSADYKWLEKIKRDNTQIEKSGWWTIHYYFFCSCIKSNFQ